MIVLFGEGSSALLRILFSSSVSPRPERNFRKGNGQFCFQSIFIWPILRFLDCVKKQKKLKLRHICFVCFFLFPQIDVAVLPVGFTPVVTSGQMFGRIKSAFRVDVKEARRKNMRSPEASTFHWLWHFFVLFSFPVNVLQVETDLNYLLRRGGKKKPRCLFCLPSHPHITAD